MRTAMSIAILLSAIVSGHAARAATDCQPLSTRMIGDRVEAILASPGREAESRLVDLYEAWEERCEPRSAVYRRSVAIDLARLLDRLHLVSWTVSMLDDMGDAARPARRRVRTAYIHHRRAMDERAKRFGFLVGQEPGIVNQLRCLDLKLETGERVEEFCRDLPARNSPRAEAPRPKT